MKKIILIGSGGAGKSTLAHTLGKLMNIDVYHLDSMFWKKGWVPISREELIQQQKQIFTKESWIIDGNYSSTLELRLEAADTIIFLNLPRIQCVYRVIKRRIQYHNRIRPDMGEGCKEKLDMEFLKWVWTFPKSKKPNILSKLRELANDKQVIILNSSAEVNKFLNQIEKTYFR